MLSVDKYHADEIIMRQMSINRKKPIRGQESAVAMLDRQRT